MTEVVLVATNWSVGFLSGRLLLLLMLLASLGVFTHLMWVRIRLLTRARAPEENPFLPVGARIKKMLTIAFGQSKIFKDPVAGPMHALIFWGFLVLALRTITLFVDGFPRGSVRRSSRGEPSWLIFS